MRLLIIVFFTFFAYGGVLESIKHFLVQQEYRVKDYNSSLKDFKSLNRDSTTYFEIATTLYRLARYKEAISYYKMVKDASLVGMVYYNIANCYYKLGNYNRASKFYKSASKFKFVKEKALKNLKINNKKAKLAKAYKIKDCKGKDLGLGDTLAKLDDFNDPFVSKNLKLAKLKEQEVANVINSKKLNRAVDKIELNIDKNRTKKSDKATNLNELKEQRVESKLKEIEVKTLLIPLSSKEK